MTLTLDYIKRRLGWCPNANRMAIKTRAEASSAFGASERFVKNPGPAGSDRSGKPWGWEYEHTQRGILIIAAVTAVILIIIASMIVFGPVWVTLIVAGIMILALAMFSTLTVSVQRDALRLWFGPIRLIKKSWPISEIASVTTVTNRWYYGWGIRWTPTGPLYNIAGLQAVEVTLVSGKVFRIGTDEPEELKRAIEQAQYGKKPR
ncbi:MAG: hypothetical protein ACP5NN_03995 [Methanolinea sp.]